MSRQVGAKRRTYDASLVDVVAESVKSGSLSLCQASKTYNIPKTTLHDRVNKKYFTSKIGKRTVLTDEEESRLEQWALHMSRIGFGRTRRELVQVVKQILDADGRKTPFVDNKPGRKWINNFFARHPSLNLRTTVQLGKERAIINKEKIVKWFEELEKYVTDEVGDPMLLQDPTRIYNADESGISLCQTKNRKVIGETGAPVVYQYGNSDKTQMTIMAAASAVGHYIQPMIIYPGQRFSYNPLEGFEEAALGRSDNGWMDSEVFTSWLQEVFIPGVEARQVKKPVLLLIDGHKTHVTMKASDICVENGIEMYCLLEHSSHLTQPLDLRLFGLLKQSWREAVRKYQSENIGEFVTKQTFAKVFKQAWTKSATIEAAVKGFQESGIFPWNPQRVAESVKLVPSSIFINEEEKSPPPSGPSDAASQTTNQVSDIQPTTETRSTVVPVDIEPIAPPVPVPDDDSMEASELQITTAAISMQSTVTSSLATSSVDSTSSAISIPSATSMPASTSDNPSPFSKYLVLPKSEKKSKARRMLVPKAITGDKYRQWLKEKEAKKEADAKAKEQRQKERLEKKEKRVEELKQKKIRQEQKRKEREEAMQMRKQAKERRREERERILKEIDDSDSDHFMDISMSNCFQCESPIADGEHLRCTNCLRKFHLQCVSDELIEGPDELPFECRYC